MGAQSVAIHDYRILREIVPPPVNVIAKNMIHRYQPKVAVFGLWPKEPCIERGVPFLKFLFLLKYAFDHLVELARGDEPANQLFNVWSVIHFGSNRADGITY
jgi:hypothetical protein